MLLIQGLPVALLLTSSTRLHECHDMHNRVHIREVKAYHMVHLTPLANQYI